MADGQMGLVSGKRLAEKPNDFSGLEVTRRSGPRMKDGHKDLCRFVAGDTADDINPASPNICYTTIIPRVLVHKQLQGHAGSVSSTVARDLWNSVARFAST